ncbi:MAG TPA: hypothetical protein VMX57_04590 [Planctomycetota bacterium]|nr:hypothetical protein [Planctomycetota bacterium]
MATYKTVANIAALRALDDAAFDDGTPCLVADADWFLIARGNAAPDDGIGVLSCSSGNGRWCIMTPATAGIVTSAIDAEF